MRLRMRLILLFFILILAVFTTGTKADIKIELSACTDRCDRNYIACCQQQEVVIAPPKLRERTDHVLR